MTHIIKRFAIGLAVLTCFGLNGPLVYAADTSQVAPATKQVESGTKQVGHGVEQTAKGVGNTVVEGAKVTGQTLQEAGKSAQPRREGWRAAPYSARGSMPRAPGSTRP